MPYMLLVVEDPAQRRTRTPLEGEAVYKRMVNFGQELQARGLLVASESLSSHASAARVSVSNGKALVVDGPFAEAKEMIGGFFLLNCKSWAEAVAIAGQCPAAEWATIEVRATGPCYDDETDPAVNLH
ncbi:MAG: YciI family protein [Pseudomonadota bacterium]